jgi:hypothetical protein
MTFLPTFLSVFFLLLTLFSLACYGTLRVGRLA